MKQKLASNIPIMFMIFVLSGGIVGGVISVVSDNVYVADAAVQIGRVGTYPEQDSIGRGKLLRVMASKQIEQTEDLHETLRAKYRVPDAKKGFLELPYLFFIETRGGGVIRLSARGRSPQEVEEYLNGIVSWVTARHSNRYEEAISILEKNLSYFKERSIALDPALKRESTRDDELKAGSVESGKLIVISDDEAKYFRREIAELMID